MTKHFNSPYWARTWQETAAELETSGETGLQIREAARRRRQYGPNRLKKKKRKPLWTILVNQLRSLIVLLLMAAGSVSVLFGDWIDGLAIGVVILINTAIGFFTELRAVRSMESLSRLGQVNTRVRRGGREQEIPARSLVPGDVVLIEGGDIPQEER